MGQGNKKKLSISIFDGGLNTKQQASQIPLNCAVIARWVYLDDYGSLKNANGIATYNSSVISDSPWIDGLVSFKPAAMSAQLIAIGGGHVFVATGVATAFTTIASSQSLFTTLVYCESAAFQDLLFLSNGDTQPYKYNGTEFTRAGISAPTQNLTAVCDAAAGNLNGTYQYVLWGVNSYSAEGDYGTASTAVAVTSAKVRINNIPTAPISHGINTWKVGRNTANASGVYWYLTDIANGTTSFTDNVADSSLVTLAPADQGYLRKFKYFSAYAGRLWGAVEDYLWFSNLNQPEEFPSTNFIRVGRGDGMNISSIRAFKGSIVVSKSDFAGKTAIYNLFIGDSGEISDPENWYLKFISDFGGSEAHRATIPYSNYLMMYNRDGIYAYAGAGISPVGAETQNGLILADTISQNVESSVRPGTLSAAIAAAGINHKNKIWLSIPSLVGSGSPPFTNDTTYLFDYTRASTSDRKGGAWTQMTFVRTSQFAVHEGMLVAADNGTAGRIYQLDTGTPSLSTNRFFYITGYIYGDEGHEGIHKDFKYIDVTCSGSGTLAFNEAVDGGDNETFTITLTSSLTTHRLKLNGQQHAKFMQIQMQLSIGGTLTLNRIDIYYTLRGLRNG